MLLSDLFLMILHLVSCCCILCLLNMCVICVGLTRLIWMVTVCLFCRFRCGLVVRSVSRLNVMVMGGLRL